MRKSTELYATIGGSWQANHPANHDSPKFTKRWWKFPCDRSIERFHSRDQQLCKFIGTKESVYIRKTSTLTGLVWYTNMAAVSSFLVHQYGRRDVMWKEILIFWDTKQFFFNRKILHISSAVLWKLKHPDLHIAVKLVVINPHIFVISAYGHGNETDTSALCIVYFQFFGPRPHCWLFKSLHFQMAKTNKIFLWTQANAFLFENRYLFCVFSYFQAKTMKNKVSVFTRQHTTAFSK